MIKKKIPGIIITVMLAAVAMMLSEIKVGAFSFDVIGAPVFSILIGMIITLILPGLHEKESMVPGLRFTSKKILQWAVILLGFSLNIGTILKVGGKSLPVIISTISISLIVAYIVMKITKIDGKTACLIGVGSSICGGSAIAATAPVIDADESEVARAISVIFLFNVIAALVFPAFGHAVGLGSEGFAIFAGTAVNDTSSVTATAATAENIYGVEGILSAAVTVKLTRTLAIIPITLALSVWKIMKAGKNQNEGKSYSIRGIFPFFILYFIAAAVITTVMGVIPPSEMTGLYFDRFVPAVKWIAKLFIAMAMCAIGMNTNLSELVKKGGKSLLLGFICWMSITTASLLVQHLTGIYYSEIIV